MNNPFLTDQPARDLPLKLAVVTSVTGGLFLRLEGEQTPRQKSYKWLSPYTPASGDRVLVALIGGGVVVGKVVD